MTGEQLLADVTVYVDDNNNGILDSGEIWTQTESDGSYRFQVEAGTHIVRSEVTETERVITEPLPAQTYTVTVEIGARDGRQELRRDHPPRSYVHQSARQLRHG